MSSLPAVNRETALARLAEWIGRLPAPARVAIDGVYAAGKTTLADELAARIAAARLSADDFLRSPEERYRRGRESPEATTWIPSTTTGSAEPCSPSTGS